MHGKSDWITLAYYAKSEALEKVSLSLRFISIETFTNKAATFPGIDVASLHKKELFYASLAKFQFDEKESEREKRVNVWAGHALRH